VERDAAGDDVIDALRDLEHQLFATVAGWDSPRPRRDQLDICADTFDLTEMVPNAGFDDFVRNFGRCNASRWTGDAGQSSVVRVQLWWPREVGMGIDDHLALQVRKNAGAPVILAGSGAG
jgi:hypothetical protein